MATPGTGPTDVALLVRFGDHAKAENRFARLVGNVHSQLCPGGYCVVQIAEDFAGGLCRLDPGRGHIRQFDSVAVESRAFPVADTEKISRHGLALFLRPHATRRSKEANQELSVQN